MFKVILTHTLNYSIIVKSYLKTFGFLFAWSFGKMFVISNSKLLGFCLVEPRIIRFSFCLSYLCLLVNNYASQRNFNLYYLKINGRPTRCSGTSFGLVIFLLGFSISQLILLIFTGIMSQVNVSMHHTSCLNIHFRF